MLANYGAARVLDDRQVLMAPRSGPAMPQSTRIIFYTRRKKAMLLRNKPRAQADPQNRTTNAHVNRLVVLLHLVASLSCLLVNQLGQLLNLARLLLIFHPLSLKNLLKECIVQQFVHSPTPGGGLCITPAPASNSRARKAGCQWRGPKRKRKGSEKEPRNKKRVKGMKHVQRLRKLRRTFCAHSMHSLAAAHAFWW